MSYLLLSDDDSVLSTVKLTGGDFSLETISMLEAYAASYGLTLRLDSVTGYNPDVTCCASPDDVRGWINDVALRSEL
jgi:hypothetical protein